MLRTYDEVYKSLSKYESDFFMPIMLAQWALESDYGRSELSVKANNFTGHKTTGWTGKVYKKDTIEYDKNGKAYVAKSEPFRHYDSPSEWAKHHASWLQRLPDTYAKAITAKSVQEQAQALQNTYATDINYASELMKKIEEDGLMKYDKKKGNGNMAYIGIDIGHGSNTWSSGGGKGVSVGGKVYQEHNFNSIVGKKLKKLLEQSGHKVTFGVQQPNSPDTSLASRTNRFNAEKVDILVSVHANWFGSFGNSTNGIAAFYAGYSAGSRQNNSKKLADLIMNAYRKQGQEIYHGGSVRSYIGNWTNFHMTREVNMPAVLMELGFMSGSRDFDKVFGSQQDKYTTQMAQGMAEGINAYFGVANKSVDTHNPQGMSETKPSAYKAPRLPFETLKVGDKVTLLDDKNSNGDYIWLWYNPTNNTLLKSKRQAELAGTTDTIKEVKKIDKIQHSQYAYLLKDTNSWILEEYLEEPRKNWEVVEVDDEDDEDKVEDGKEVKPLKDGQFWWNDVLYQINEVK